MKKYLADKRLLIKILFWFWVASLLINIVFVLAPFITESQYFPAGWRNVTETALVIYGSNAADIYEKQGENAAKEYLERVETQSKIRSYILDGSGRELAGHPITDEFESAIDYASLKETTYVIGNTRTILAALKIETASNNYIFLSEIPRALSFSVFDVEPRVRLLRFILLLLTSFFVCLWLARYLTNPIMKLNAATQQIAKGDLSARIGPIFGRRKDEITDLSNSFDQMAEKLENLIRLQNRLLGDISHELRSPLTRLGVAVSLARDGSKIEVDDALDVIEREAASINEMIDQLLTLTKLESLNDRHNFTEIDLSALVKEIASDAKFETLDKNKNVRLGNIEEFKITGDRKILRSAIENVVRNALKYTAENTSVEIELRRISDRAEIRVRDHGEGVPDNALEDIFRPFYRVMDARDRSSGGTGLGLAIAERAVKLHKGTIKARNAEGRGLIVTITL